MIVENPNQIAEITEKTLNDIWCEITYNDNSFDSKMSKLIFIEEFKRQFPQQETTNFNFNTHGWVIKNTKANSIKSLLIASVFYGILDYVKPNEFSLVLIPTIVPLLIDIEQIQITGKEENVLIELRKLTNSKYHTPKSLYNKLDKKAKKKITLWEFEDFLNKFFLGGLILKNKDSNYLILEKGKSKFKITIL